MAPLIDNSDLSASSQDEIFDVKTGSVPLHELTDCTAPRRVSFFPMSVTYGVLSRDDYSAEEFKASWFNVDDMLRMKQDARSTAKLYRSGSLVTSKNACIRGLESRTREGMKRKREARLNTYSTVFSELDKQRKNDVYAQELVAHAYSYYSQQSARLAQSLGKQDAVEACAIHKEGKAEDYFGTDYFRKTVVDISTSLERLTASTA